MIDTNVIKALSGLFSALSDLSDAELGRFVRTAVKLLQCRDGYSLTEEDVESLFDNVYANAGPDEKVQEEETSDIPVDALPPKVDFVTEDENTVIINVTHYPRVQQSILVHFTGSKCEVDGECPQECCQSNQEMVYEEVTGNMDNVRTEGKDATQEQERIKACSRVAAFINDKCKVTPLEIWQCMQNEGLSTMQDVAFISRCVADFDRGMSTRSSLISFIQWKTLLENGQARFLESRSIGKDPTVGWRLCSDSNIQAGVMCGYEQGSLFMVTQCDSLLPEYISVKLRRVMCENYDAIMEDVYAMCARLSKANAFNEVPITKDEFNTLRNLVL